MQKRNPESLLYKFEYLFSFFYITFFSIAIIQLIVSGGASEGDDSFFAANVRYDSPITTLITFLNYIVTFVLISLRWKKVLAVFLSNKSLFFCSP